MKSYPLPHISPSIFTLKFQDSVMLYFILFYFFSPCSNNLIIFIFQDTVECLLRHQADVNARDKNWQTPLHVAAANNAVKCAEYLIPMLTNVNVSDRAGRTSLHHAAFNGHVEVYFLVIVSLFVVYSDVILLNSRDSQSGGN